jgi:hypothetical protein
VVDKSSTVVILDLTGSEGPAVAERLGGHFIACAARISAPMPT